MVWCEPPCCCALRRWSWRPADAPPADLPSSRSAFAEFILGPEPTQYPMAKPINAALNGQRLYVCDTVFNTVIIYDLVTGGAHRLAGDRGIGKIQQPNNIDIDNEGRLYVADKVRKAVLVYAPDESFVDAWGRPEEIQPVDVVVGGDELFVCGSDTHEVEVWSRKDGSLLRKFGKLGTAPGEFFIPTYLALDGKGHLFVTDTGNFRIQKLTLDGQPVAVYGGPGTTFGKFAWPKGIDVDGDGRLFAADSRFANVQVFDEEGRLLLFFGAPGPDGGNLDLPAGVRVMPWPSIPWMQERLLPGFEPESLAIVVNQQGWNFVNFFAIAKDTE
jgi:sugar lactone lactonase YvrE